MSPMLMLAHGGGGSWFPLVLPPVHPILVNFTAALVPTSVAADVAGRLARRRSLADAGWWTLLAAVLVTPLTAAAGWYWMSTMHDMDHPQMPVHKWLGIALAVVLPGLLWWRWRSYRRGDSPGWAYLAGAAIVVAALVVQGHLGGTMSFGAEDKSPMAIASPPADGAVGIHWQDHIELPNATPPGGHHHG